ncbi:MAG: glycosyltransferase family 4 protein [Halorientalis sp.]
MAEVSVLHVLNQASETSIPLEIAARLPEEGVDVEVCSFREPAEDTFGVEVHSLGASSQLDPRSYLRLVRLVRRLDPDVVHVHPNATGSVVRVLLAAFDVTLVTTEHTSHERFGSAKRLLNGTTNALNATLVANSRPTLGSLARWERVLLRVTGTETVVVHNGVDVSAIEDAAEPDSLPVDPSRFLIGTVGRLSPVKNQAALLRAVAPLLEEHDELAVVVVGNGPLRADLNALAEDLGISDAVHFLGRLDRRDVYDILTVLDVFAFPSHHEGFGVAVAEAMAAGVPVVASDIPALREVVGEAGLYVDPDDVASLRDALRTLHEDPTRREELASAGAERVRSQFSLDSTVQEYAALYESLAGD